MNSKKNIMAITIKALKSVQTIEELEDLNVGYLQYDIGYRGGYIGFSGAHVSEALGIPEWQLTGKVGAYVNYLGGGIRGSVCVSEFHQVENARKARLVEELVEACKRAYINAENETSMNDEVFEDEETNWDAVGTNAARIAGISRAY